jgi:nitrate/TMAO reductase-like tetraheme cytochrome c subunit
MEISMFSDPFIVLALVTTAGAAVLLVWFLVKRPSLTRATKVVLLFGIGVLPLLTAANGNIAGYNAMKTREFCGSCHVMTPYAEDSSNPASMGLAARHARNEAFGKENCYTCHADYGMFGTVTTKLAGLRHVYEYTFNFHMLSLEEALPKIHILEPFPNSTCIRCHSTQNPMWNAIGDHASTLSEVRAGTISCASAGCHGPAHPFSHEIHERERAKAGGS